MTVTFFPFAVENPFWIYFVLARVLSPPHSNLRVRERENSGWVIRSICSLGTDSVHRDTASGPNASSIFLLEKRSPLLHVVVQSPSLALEQFPFLSPFEI